MNLSIDQLAKSILQKDTLEQCSLQELQHLADQYPYYGAVQLLLAKKLQSENDEQYNKQLQKASLFFHNPLWLEHLMNDTGNAEIVPAAVTGNEEKSQSIREEIKTEQVNIPGEKEEEIIETETESNYQEESIDENSQLPVELPAFKIELPDSYQDDPAKAELTFEPYHTVDYFASQGIKFKDEASPQDKFGKQLKSFTEWLKTLKRLPDSPIIPTIEATAEQKVEELADQSLQDREIITEAMADVWAKQGDTTKAIDIYNKLSLLDASKRPYFAAKIEELKKLN